MTRIAIIADSIAVIILIVYFAVVAIDPTPILGIGTLLMSPPLFGVIGMITTVAGVKESSGKINIILYIVNSVFICWWFIIMVGGTLLFGP